MLNYKKLHITYSNPDNFGDSVQIDYKIRQTPIAAKWVDRVLTAQRMGYSIDDPCRFYGFGSIEEQTNDALSNINNIIIKLKHWINIDYQLISVADQDVLNQLHHVFEMEHGLLDKKNPDSVFKQHLCNLNLAVHRCESVARGAYPRHVVTYFGLPKDQILDDNDYQYFERPVTFGTVYINYVEIGKTLYDLMLDNDRYIQPEAVQPFCHYSADFVVKFWADSGDALLDDLQTYYAKHQDFFTSIGYDWEELARSIGSIPVADLDHSGDILKDLESRQFVKAVDFS